MKALNYAPQAINNLMAIAKAIKPHTPVYAAYLSKIATMLSKAEKYVIPPNADLVTRPFKPEHYARFRLPYPIIAFEFEYDLGGKPSESEAEGIPIVPAYRRIALAFDRREVIEEYFPDLLEIYDAFPDGCVFVIAIWASQAMRRGLAWTTSSGCSAIPRGPAFDPAAFPEGPATPFLEKIKEIEYTDPSRQVRMMSIPLIDPKHFRVPDDTSEPMSKERHCEVINYDTRTETRAVAEACLILNCANVATRIVTPSATSNRIRKSRGKMPYFSYHVIEVAQDRIQHREDAGGTHASPRFHLRQGHTRTYHRGTTAEFSIWIQDMMVGDPKHGVVDKHYELLPADA